MHLVFPNRQRRLPDGLKTIVAVGVFQKGMPNSGGYSEIGRAPYAVNLYFYFRYLFFKSYKFQHPNPVTPSKDRVGLATSCIRA